MSSGSSDHDPLIAGAVSAQRSRRDMVDMTMCAAHRLELADLTLCRVVSSSV
jgi:hypothetical protein